MLSAAEVAQRNEMSDWIWGLPSRELISFVDDLEAMPGFAERPNPPALTSLWREHALWKAEDERPRRLRGLLARYRARQKAATVS